MENYDALRHFYEEEAPEELRLHPGSVQRLEYETAARYFRRCLPPKATVLDSCAGTGAYAFLLAEEGHSVTAGDLIGRNVLAMQQQNTERPRLASIYEGDALDLSRFEQGSFDAVLCMGALYHLHQPAQRQRAVRESLRVLRPGGLLFASYMNRFGVIAGNLEPDLANREDILRFARSGEEGIFYASTAGETSAMMAQEGVEPVCHLALDGPAFFLIHKAGVLQPDALDTWREIHFALCEEESLLGASYHNLYIGKKPE